MNEEKKDGIKKIEYNYICQWCSHKFKKERRTGFGQQDRGVTSSIICPNCKHSIPTTPK